MTIPVQNPYYLGSPELSKFGVSNEKSNYDSVKRPKHYVLLDVNGVTLEVRDVCKIIANRLQEGGYSGIFVSDSIQLLQYLLRFDQKENDLQDLKKARFYLDKMIEELENKE